MLKESLFKILSRHQTEDTIEAVLEIDQLNEIFAGHFPDQPIVPGACMLQIVKEILADALNKPLRLVKADNIKFLSLVQPATQSLQLSIAYTLTDNDIKINANLMAGETTCMKLQAIFVKA
jgi:3-hydroxyacyl-[acyl-carrier-protein] dehydratase